MQCQLPLILVGRVIEVVSTVQERVSKEDGVIVVYQLGHLFLLTRKHMATLSCCARQPQIIRTKDRY